MARRGAPRRRRSAARTGGLPDGHAPWAPRDAAGRPPRPACPIADWDVGGYGEPARLWGGQRALRLDRGGRGGIRYGDD